MIQNVLFSFLWTIHPSVHLHLFSGCCHIADILIKKKKWVSSLWRIISGINMCLLVGSFFISNVAYWHEPSIWSMTVYKEEVRRGLLGHRLFIPPSSPLSSSYFSISVQLKFTIHGIRGSWKCAKDGGVASLFNHPPPQHTHIHTHTSLPLIAPPPFTPTSHSAPIPPLLRPSHLLPLNNTWCRTIKEEYASTYLCTCSSYC